MKKIFKYNKFNEIYSSAKEEVEDFLDELPEDITLYRAVLIAKNPDEGFPLDKNNLGVSWTLDYEFARNIYDYETFEIDEEDAEGLNLCIVTAEFKKSDINYEKTVDKRMQLRWTPEDEIVVKKDSKPNILNIEYFDLSDKDISKTNWGESIY